MTTIISGSLFSGEFFDIFCFSSPHQSLSLIFDLACCNSYFIAHGNPEKRKLRKQPQFGIENKNMVYLLIETLLEYPRF